MGLVMRPVSERDSLRALGAAFGCVIFFLLNYITRLKGGAFLLMAFYAALVEFNAIKTETGDEHSLTT